MSDYLPVNDLIPGRAYLVRARNFEYAIWTGGTFAGLREKFGSRFIDRESHWDDAGTVKPLRLLE